MSALLWACPARAGLLDVDQGKEVSIGESTAKEIIAAYGEVDDPAEVDRLKSISTALIAASGRPELPYRFAILRTDIINAMALPGGYVLVTQGLMDFVRDDDELAAVLAHEIVHVSLKHGVTMYKQSMRGMFMNFLLLVLTRSPEAVIAGDMINENKMTLYGRKAEMEADKFSIDYLEKAGYDPNAMVRFLEKMKRYEMRRPALFEDYFDTHPPTEERIQLVKNHFKDLHLTPVEEDSDSVSTRLLAQEKCEPKDNGRVCYGLVVDGEREVMRFGDRAGFLSPYERARAAASALNSEFEKGVSIYEVKTRAAGSTWSLMVRGRRVADVLPGDVMSVDSDPEKVAASWQASIRLFLWTDYVKKEI